MDVTINDQPELRIAGIRHIGPYPRDRQARSRGLGGIAGLASRAAPDDRHVSRRSRVDGHDRLRSDAALTLPGNAYGPDGLIEQRIPAGRYARVVHKGSYEGLPAHGRR